MGNPQHQFKSVHVAGTNGKGSSSHMLAAVMQSAGFKTGLYTSPHLKEFTERVRVNGQELSQEYLVAFVENYKALFEQVQPSFFEMTVALAFRYFADEQVDIAIIEVGLGGRLDSTNIIQPEVSLITNIGLDHQAMLGDTLQAIAGEKAGIIKPDTPAVISTSQAELEQVYREKASLENAPLYFAMEEVDVKPVKASLDKQVFNVLLNGQSYLPQLELDLTGSYQQFNLPGVLKTILILQEQGWTISEAVIRKGLGNTQSLTGLKGRWQVLGQDPLTICDTGHNEDGIKHIVAQLQQLAASQVHMVFGAVNDKDISSILRLLPTDYIYYFCQARLPRALDVETLQQQAAAAGLQGKAYPTVGEAIAAAKAKAAPDDVIFIGGSTFVVAEIEEL